MKQLRLWLTITLTLLITTPTIAAHITAPDATQNGPFQVGSGEYHFPATIDPDVLANTATELWASIHYPKDISTTSDKLPLILMLHGNHATCASLSDPQRSMSCEYTETGNCPTDFAPIPNHAGYDYLATNLASHGYIVVSINANRGITCGDGTEEDWGLNLARGKLVLKHLSVLYQWATTGNAPESLGLPTNALIGKIDFSAVGFMGHSRGGEGVRAAYNLYRDENSPWPTRIPGLTVKAIFEIGAVDGQTPRVLDAYGTHWNQLLPMCDGDVSSLEGRMPFERMLNQGDNASNAQKSLYEVWGANHNFFNTEWLQNDNYYGCLAGEPLFEKNARGSLKQQATALASLPAFFRSHLNAKRDADFNQNFNPLAALPNVTTAITQIDRDFTPSAAANDILVADDFNKETGTNSSGNPNLTSQILIEHATPSDWNPHQMATITWEKASPDTFYEAIMTERGQGLNVQGFATLDLRIARRAKSPLNQTPTTAFSIVLEDAAGHTSKPIASDRYAIINGPGNYIPVMQTLRIPLADFEDIDLTKIRGVKCIFDKTSQGVIYLAHIRFQRQLGVGMTTASTTRATMTQKLHPLAAIPTVYVPAQLNTIRSIRSIANSTALTTHTAAVEIRVASQEAFPSMDRLPILQIGKQAFKISRYADKKNLKELTFTLTAAEFKQLDQTSTVTVLDGKIWQFGKLTNLLRQTKSR